MQVISAEEIRRHVSYGDMVEALRKGFASGIVAPLRHHHGVERAGHPEATLLLMPAWSDFSDAAAGDGYIGLKVLTVFPDNPAAGRPSIQGSYFLISGETGAPVAIIDGVELTVRRTSCASALAADYLARKDADTMVMVGAGALAGHLVRAHAAVRPIRRVSVWNRTREKAAELAAELGREGFEAQMCGDLAAAVREADIVSCATMSDRPLVEGAWLKPGAHLDLVGAFKPELRESDDEAMRRGSVFVDTREGALSEAGDIVQAVRSGALSEDRIRADLFDLVAGRSRGRESEEEITVFKSVGAALEDLAGAMLIHERVAR